jgi:2-polyprenyl-6-hydroxyphenyl methylase/3-demethylubiquinone-9 3-methyltransferase
MERTDVSNLDPVEIAKFSALAADWWDREGSSRPLHEINPCRVEFIAAEVPLAGRRLLDVGCGGGILSEALARLGARVTGLDGSTECIEAARAHAAQSGLDIDYVAQTVEAHRPVAPYPVVTCMELLEHVPSPPTLLAACRERMTDDGDLFVATLNRTPRAYASAILGAEYLLGLLPRGTHDYRSFVRPSELARWLRDAGFEVVRTAGMHYNPLTRTARLVRDVDVNYLVHARVRQ